MKTARHFLSLRFGPQETFSFLYTETSCGEILPIFNPVVLFCSTTCTSYPDGPTLRRRQRLRPRGILLMRVVSTCASCHQLTPVQSGHGQPFVVDEAGLKGCSRHHGVRQSSARDNQPSPPTWSRPLQLMSQLQGQFRPFRHRALSAGSVRAERTHCAQFP